MDEHGTIRRNSRRAKDNQCIDAVCAPKTFNLIRMPAEAGPFGLFQPLKCRRVGINEDRRAEWVKRSFAEQCVTYPSRMHSSSTSSVTRHNPIPSSIITLTRGSHLRIHRIPSRRAEGRNLVPNFGLEHNLQLILIWLQTAKTRALSASDTTWLLVLILRIVNLS